MKKRRIAAIAICIIAMGAACIIKASLIQNNLLEMNVEALAQTESQTYNNAKAAYCSPYSDRIGCKSAFLRTCTGVFCE